MKRDNVQKFLDSAVLKGVFPGCCCVIIKNHQADYYCAGYKAIFPHQEENDLDTLYDLASLTKVVGTLPTILRLIQDDVLSYQTPIVHWFKEFQNPQVTLWHLLTHTSGLPADLDCGNHFTKEEMIHRICQHSAHIQCGQHVIYSDLGYIMLGEIIELVTNLTLDEAVKTKVLQPLKMYDTMFSPQTDLYTRCAPTEWSPHFHYLIRGEVHDRKAHYFHGVSGHAGLFSCVLDLKQYMSMILDEGMFQNQCFLKKELIQDLYTNISPNGEIARGVGYLCYDQRSPFSFRNSAKSLLHTGFSGTSLLIDIEKQIGIALLSNRIHPSRDRTKILSWRKAFHEYVMQEYD